MTACGCGCGNPVRMRRGKSNRFLRGHHSRAPGYWNGSEAKRVAQLRLAGERRRKDPMAIDYSALHKWIRHNFSKAGSCEKCGAVRSTEWSLIPGCVYSRDRADYLELCLSCHRTQDARESPRKRIYEAEFSV